MFEILSGKKNKKTKQCPILFKGKYVCRLFQATSSIFVANANVKEMR